MGCRSLLTALVIGALSAGTAIAQQLLHHEPLNGSMTTSWPPTATSTRAWQRVLIV
jgi:hypothetical protein